MTCTCGKLHSATQMNRFIKSHWICICVFLVLYFKTMSFSLKIMKKSPITECSDIDENVLLLRVLVFWMYRRSNLCQPIWTFIVPAYCTYAYELISRMNSIPYTHPLIYSCMCIPAICMYGHAHAHKPLVTHHHMHALIKRITNKNEYVFLLSSVFILCPITHAMSPP
jgi:hypothetical protein